MRPDTEGSRMRIKILRTAKQETLGGVEAAGWWWGTLITANGASAAALHVYPRSRLLDRCEK